MTLEEIRTEIDSIDNEMKPLFIRRMKCAKEVARVKAASGGSVYVPEREQTVVRRRSFDVETDIREEYTAFLLHLMSVCRRYEYGLLEDRKEETVKEALHMAGLSADTEHESVECEFRCSYETGDLNMFVNMARLNRVGIIRLLAERVDGWQQVTMTLEGNVNDEGMKCLLCQIKKEAEAFRILGLKQR